SRRVAARYGRRAGAYRTDPAARGSRRDRSRSLELDETELAQECTALLRSEMAGDALNEVLSIPALLRGFADDDLRDRPQIDCEPGSRLVDKTGIERRQRFGSAAERLQLRRSAYTRGGRMRAGALDRRALHFVDELLAHFRIGDALGEQRIQLGGVP